MYTQKTKMKKRHFKYLTGFTLVELIISMAVMAILATVGFSNYIGERNKRNLELTAEVIVRELNFTMSRSKAQEGGYQWWMHFDNPVGNSNDAYITCFGTYTSSGASCAAEGGAEAKRSNLGGLEFTDPAPGASKDVIFAKATGLPTATTVITINSRLGAGSKTITINANGSIASISSGGGHWDMVNDTEADPGDGNTTYVYTSSATEQKDMYAIQNHTTESGTINSVLVRAWGKGDGCQKVYLRLGGVEDGGFSSSCGGDTAWNISSQYSINTKPGTFDPFTWTDIDNLQIGVGIYKNGAADMKTTKISLTITYNGTQTLILRPNGTGDYTNINSQFP